MVTTKYEFEATKFKLDGAFKGMVEHFDNKDFGQNVGRPR